MHSLMLRRAAFALLLTAAYIGVGYLGVLDARENYLTVDATNTDYGIGAP